MNKYVRHSRAIYAEFWNKPRFNRPNELIDALKAARKDTGKYPVYSGGKSADSFVRFLTEKQLNGFEQFGKPRWKPHGSGKSGMRTFQMEVADTYAGSIYPDRTPYGILALWKKGGLFDGKGSNVRYDVSIFIDGGQHIDTQTVEAKRPIPLKKVLKLAVEKSLEIKGKCFDGYWY